MEAINVVGLGAGGGIIGIIIFALFKYCYKKHLHSNKISGKN